RTQVDLRVEPEAGLYRLLDAFLVDDRQHAGHGRIDQAHLRVRLGSERGGGTGEQLRIGDDLRVHLQTKNDFPAAGAAFDEGAVRRHVRVPDERFTAETQRRFVGATGRSPAVWRDGRATCRSPLQLCVSAALQFILDGRPRLEIGGLL